MKVGDINCTKKIMTKIKCIIFILLNVTKYIANKEILSILIKIFFITILYNVI